MKMGNENFIGTKLTELWVPKLMKMGHKNFIGTKLTETELLEQVESVKKNPFLEKCLVDEELVFERHINAAGPGAPLPDARGKLPLHYLCDNPNLTKKMFEALHKLNPGALKEEDVRGRVPLHYICENGSLGSDIFRTVYEAYPDAIKIKDKEGQHPLDLREDASVAFFEATVKNRSLGGENELHERMREALRERNLKGVEELAETFVMGGGPDGTESSSLDFFGWQQFLEIVHLDAPNQYMVELKILFDASWSLLLQRSKRTDEYNTDLVSRLTDSIVRYVQDNKEERPNLLSELLMTVKGSYLQKVAATRIFRELLKAEMRSGLMLIYYCEAILYIIYLVNFAVLTVDFKFAKSLEEEWENPRAWTMVLVCFALGSYFLLREVAQFYAMYKLGLWKNWFQDPWNWVDVLASGGSLALIVLFLQVGPVEVFDNFASVVSIFVWIKLLGFLKAFSLKVSTFVLMMKTIFMDLRSFMAVLVVIMATFGHAFYLVLSNGNNHDNSESDIAFSSIENTAGTLYTFLLGTFETDAYPTYFSYALFLAYSFIVVIILLNVLIAIVGDSYDGVLVKSEELFWRSRLELVAEISTTFEWLLCGQNEWENRLRRANATVEKKIREICGISPQGQLEHIDHQVKEVGAGNPLGSTRESLSIGDSEDTNNHVQFSHRKLLVIARVLLSPLLVIICLAILILRFVFLIIPYQILRLFSKESVSASNARRANKQMTEKAIRKHLESDTTSSEWSGRVLDIANRINKKTADESNKSQRQLKAETRHLREEIELLKKDNQELKKGNARTQNMLEMLLKNQSLSPPPMYKMPASIEKQEVDTTRRRSTRLGTTKRRSTHNSTIQKERVTSVATNPMLRK